jgi:GNAT superfamily N-acetyltransferase
VTDADIIAATLLEPFQAIVPMPDSRVVDRADWKQILTPSLKQGGLNEVAHAVLDEAGADATIARTIAEYAAHGIRFRWTVGPESRPADLAGRLARAGMTRTEARVMARDTTPAEPDPRVAIVDEPAVDLFSDTMAKGWSMDPGPVRALHRLLLHDPAARSLFFLARDSGEPAGTAAYVALDRSAYLIGAVVLPSARGRGLYRALVESRLHHARARGLGLATSLAREETSAPMLEHLGFRTVARVPVFVSAPRP